MYTTKRGTTDKLELRSHKQQNHNAPYTMGHYTCKKGLIKRQDLYLDAVQMSVCLHLNIFFKKANNLITSTFRK